MWRLLTGTIDRTKVGIDSLKRGARGRGITYSHSGCQEPFLTCVRGRWAGSTAVGGSFFGNRPVFFWLVPAGLPTRGSPRVAVVATGCP